MINPELKKGDRVVLIKMGGETTVTSGDKGTVVGMVNMFDDIQYQVDWDNGTKLDLISSVDKWTTEEYINKKKKKDVTESLESYESNMQLMDNIDIFKYFNWHFLHEYLKMVRNSGITNMFGSSPYLYIGSQKIEDELRYKDLEGEEYDEMLENADKARDYMIQGTVNYLEDKNIEVSVENVKIWLPRFAKKVLTNYILLY